jgi:hypothetical protein
MYLALSIRHDRDQSKNLSHHKDEVPSTVLRGLTYEHSPMEAQALAPAHELARYPIT